MNSLILKSGVLVVIAVGGWMSGSVTDGSEEEDTRSADSRSVAFARVDLLRAERFAFWESIARLDDPDRRRKTEDLLGESLARDEEATFDRLGTLSERHPGAVHLVEVLVGHLQDRDLSEATELVQRLRGSPFLQDRVTAVLSLQAAQAVERVPELLGWLQKHGADSYVKENGPGALAEVIRQNPARTEAVFTALGGLPEGALKGRLLASVVATAASRNFEEASALVTQLIPGPSTDEAIAVYVYHAAPFDEGVAREWVAQIQDEDLRVQTLEELEDQLK